ncbi:MAG TPA: hypothetical protein VFO10_09110 [Oligoflexus sp.]|uniref:hypothetical protein n=1 Tax=Oligoflexus sp. TaxID=1971216 RepID=UPI002D80DEBA|nr:hypothetical protein [Oligoflexus sp.]HET9237397.1 hypothetical protein [Oligoflexus sp.]
MRSACMKTLLVSASFIVWQGSALAACPQGTLDLSATYPQGLPGSDLVNRPACGLAGTILQNTTLTSDHTYLLQGAVYVGNEAQNAALSINAGVTIRGSNGRDFLAIRRGSKIFAEGRADAPIVMTGFEPGKTTRGQWGGLVVNGRSTLNQCRDANASVCENSPEGGVDASYGGTIANDNSGVIRYVRIEYPGFEVSPDNELNGLTLNSVGSDTTVDFVQVIGSNDDGIELFGGTVNLKHIVIAGSQDDGLDWDFGWTGKAQYVLIKQFADDGNNGIEADNNVNNQAAAPRSNPTIANLTILGGSPKKGDGILLRRGTGASFYNSVISGATSSCINLDDAETFNARQVTFEGVVAKCSTTFADSSADPFTVSSLFNQSGTNVEADPMLNGYAVQNENSPAFSTFVDLSRDSFFEEAFFAGAVETLSGSSADWTQGWVKGL